MRGREYCCQLKPKLPVLHAGNSANDTRLVTIQRVLKTVGPCCRQKASILVRPLESVEVLLSVGNHKDKACLRTSPQNHLEQELNHVQAGRREDLR